MPSRLATFALSLLTLSACATQGPPRAIPQDAVEVAPNLFWIGESTSEQGDPVETWAIVRTRDDWRARGGNGGGGPKCWGHLTRQTWTDGPGWDINPTNSYGLSESGLVGTATDSIDTWEDAADGALDGSGLDLWGEGTVVGDHPDQLEFDGRNTIQFLDDDPAYLAWAYVSYTNGRNGEMTECDIGINDAIEEGYGDAASDPTVYDLESILVHELGHCFGLSDMYQQACADVTMYGYSDVGETRHRSLHAADVEGISRLYR